MLYPVDKLPSGVGTLTAEDFRIIQFAFIWLQTYDPNEAIHPSSMPSYNELWFMLKYFHQIQILVNTMPSCFSHVKKDHETRYIQTVSREFGECESMTYLDIRNFDFSALIAAVSGCAAQQRCL
jgi:hypothetical protein